MPTAVAFGSDRPVLSDTCVAHTSAVAAGMKIAPARGKGLGGFCTAAIAKGATVGRCLRRHQGAQPETGEQERSKSWPK